MSMLLVKTFVSVIIYSTLKSYGVAILNILFSVVVSTLYILSVRTS